MSSILDGSEQRRIFTALVVKQSFDATPESDLAYILLNLVPSGCIIDTHLAVR